jgi:hypothetical protein
MTLITDLDGLLKDVRERLYRGTTTPRDVEDLLAAVGEPTGDVEELQAELRAAEDARDEALDAMVALLQLARDSAPAAVPRDEVEAWALDHGWTPELFAKVWPVSPA